MLDPGHVDGRKNGSHDCCGSPATSGGSGPRNRGGAFRSQGFFRDPPREVARSNVCRKDPRARLPKSPDGPDDSFPGTAGLLLRHCERWRSGPVGWSERRLIMKARGDCNFRRVHACACGTQSCLASAPGTLRRLHGCAESDAPAAGEDGAGAAQCRGRWESSCSAPRIVGAPAHPRRSRRTRATSASAEVKRPARPCPSARTSLRSHLPRALLRPVQSSSVPVRTLGDRTREGGGAVAPLRTRSGRIRRCRSLLRRRGDRERPRHARDSPAQKE